MKIYKKSENKVLAELDGNDIYRYRLDINALSLDDRNTKLLLNDVAEMADIDFGVKAKLFVDAITVSESCVFLIITLAARIRRYRIKGKKQDIACRLDRAELLYCAADALVPMVKDLSDSRLLFDGTSYILFVTAERSRNKIFNALSDYGNPICIDNDFEKALIFEHSRFICSDFVRKLLL